MYVWTDDRGVINIGDSVPDKYKKSARQIESRQFELSPSERRAAAERAARTREQLTRVDPPPAPASAASAPAVIQSSRIKAGPPVTLRSGAPSDCAAAFRAYYESQACFESGTKTIYGTVNGARNPGCVAVVDPSPRCGIPVLSPYDRPEPIVVPEDAGRYR